MRVRVGLAHEIELELRADHRRESERLGPRDLRAEHLARRRLDGPAVVPHDVAEHERRPLEPRDAPERGEVGDDVEVAVALLPARDLVAGDGVHLHLEGQEVVAPLDRVPRVHLVDEELRVEPLAHEAALHVGERDDHGVDLARRDERP